MIKRIRFSPAAWAADPGRRSEEWRDDVASAAEAPPEARPRRLVLCTSLPDVLPGPRHDLLAIEWFADLDHLARFDEWRTAAGGPGRRGPEDQSVVADEVVMRGGPWLEGRWQQGGARLKHMALAVRAEGLTPGEFSDRWKGRAGRVGGPGGASVVIPDRARGLAYVQNHPLRPGPGVVPYDAVNEVYFEDLGSLHARIDWFRRNLQGGAERDLVRQAWFLAVREDVVVDPAGPRSGR